MTPNVGGIDRILRVIAGAAIIAVGVVYGSWWGAIGVLPLISAVTRWCPPYALLGMSTCGAGCACGGHAASEE